MSRCDVMCCCWFVICSFDSFSLGFGRTGHTLQTTVVTTSSDDLKMVLFYSNDLLVKFKVAVNVGLKLGWATV